MPSGIGALLESLGGNLAKSAEEKRADAERMRQFLEMKREFDASQALREKDSDMRGQEFDFNKALSLRNTAGPGVVNDTLGAALAKHGLADKMDGPPIDASQGLPKTPGTEVPSQEGMGIGGQPQQKSQFVIPANFDEHFKAQQAQAAEKKAQADQQAALDAQAKAKAEAEARARADAARNALDPVNRNRMDLGGNPILPGDLSEADKQSQLFKQQSDLEKMRGGFQVQAAGIAAKGREKVDERDRAIAALNAIDKEKPKLPPNSYDAKAMADYGEQMKTWQTKKAMYLFAVTGELPHALPSHTQGAPIVGAGAFPPPDASLGLKPQQPVNPTAVGPSRSQQLMRFLFGRDDATPGTDPFAQ